MEPWQRLDAAAPDDARQLLQPCCGSTRWIERMMARRPFGGREALLGAARDEWFALGPEDWREAFRHHPMIGDREALRRRFATTRHLAAREQAGVASAPDDVLDALAEGNQEYLNKFGFIFIVCATGRSAEEMLGMLRARLKNSPEIEIRIAAAEQAKITELRLLAIAAPQAGAATS
jgi:2-oxo-4-hydroxy-4-carboxy-5-ureidoimidazoline decarboxylase